MQTGQWVGGIVRVAVATALVFTATTRPVRAVVVEGIAAVVDGEVLLLSEVEQRVPPPGLPPPGSRGEALEARNKALRTAADEAVVDVLVQRVAQAQGLAPTAADVDRAISEIKRTNNIDDEALDAALAEQGLDRGRYRGLLERQMTRMRVVDAQVRARVSVSDDEVKARYRTLVAGIQGTEQRRVLDLIVPRSGTADEWRRKAQALRRRWEAGESVESLSREAGSPLADSGGDLGWMSPGDLQPPLEKALSALRSGETSPVVESGGVLHVLRIADTRAEGAPRPLSEAREEIRQQLLSEKAASATDAYLEELRREARIEWRLP